MRRTGEARQVDPNLLDILISQFSVYCYFIAFASALAVALIIASEVIVAPEVASIPLRL
jgi:hypothetical protein